MTVVRASTHRSRVRGSEALPGVVLGLGLGGFVDGILLHQVLQWHSLIAARRSRETLSGLEANVLADGLFHVATWVLVAVGLALLLRASRAAGVSARPLVGWMLVGWGVFNVLDSILFHWLLGLHHIRMGEHELAYDLAFFAFGLALIAGGWAVARRR